jgi:hypothetical protein
VALAYNGTDLLVGLKNEISYYLTSDLTTNNGPPPQDAKQAPITSNLDGVIGIAVDPKSFFVYVTDYYGGPTFAQYAPNSGQQTGAQSERRPHALESAGHRSRCVGQHLRVEHGEQFDQRVPQRRGLLVHDPVTLPRPGRGRYLVGTAASVWAALRRALDADAGAEATLQPGKQRLYVLPGIEPQPQQPRVTDYHH